jgi:cation diffusion facilitator family transporter
MIGKGGEAVEVAQVKLRTAAVSIASNSTLILIKVIAGTLTGSVSVLTEAIHSSIDLIASVVAFFSVRKADEPADESHRYGHEKIENLSAAIEGILILVGSAVIVFEAVRRLFGSGQVHEAGIGIAVIAASMVVNVVVSTLIGRTASATDSAALEGDAAHLRTDAMTSAGVLVGLALVATTGAQWIDPVVALLVAASIVYTGVKLVGGSSRALVDHALPEDEVATIRDAIERFGPGGVVGYHELRTRRAGARRYVDLHVQFRSGTSLEDAHRTAHELQDEIAERISGVDVLIHIEPEDRVRPGEVLPAVGDDGDPGVGGEPGVGAAGSPGPGVSRG